ncbi:hypothetical protein [Halobacillus rhizosphaerae]|uniref:hypothetical protein n=1 Tax=Halobacillus rhizosphaerae TaxID=3064889 RepID=UPI00398A5385
MRKGVSLLEKMFIISPPVYRFMRDFNIRDFLAMQGFELNEELANYEISEDEEHRYGKLMNELVKNGELTKDIVLPFLVDQSRYSVLRNIFLHFISYEDEILDPNNILKNLKKLSHIDEAFGDLVNCKYLGPINTNSYEKELIYLNTEETGGVIEKLHIVLRKPLKLYDGTETVDNYAFEVDFRKGMLIAKVKNWEQESQQNLTKNIEYFTEEIKKSLNLRIINTDHDIQKVLKSMLNDLTSKVLNKVFMEVNEKLDGLVEKEVDKWSKKLLGEPLPLPAKELIDIKNNILNNFYKLYRLSIEDGQAIEDLHEKYGVEAYPRIVRFMDETIGEGKASSSDPTESLLDTSLYYDIRTRLESSKSLRHVTVYWLTCHQKSHFGTTLHNDRRNEFKINIKPHTYTKEMLEYVLRKIERYIE